LRQPQALIDPLGGAQDLHSGVLRACSRDSLSDDPVRILRCVRLAVHFEFRIAPDTRRLIHQALPRLSQVSVERMRDELFRILEDPKAVTALRTLDHLGALDAILPELAELKDVEQSPPHNYDVWTHTLHTAQRLYDLLGILGLEHDPESASNWSMGLVSLRLGRFRKQLDDHLKATLNPERPLRAILLLAALYHDVAKPQTRKVDEDWRIRFIDHERLGVQIVRQRAMHLHLSNLEVDRLGSIVRNHMRPLVLAQGDQPPTHRAIYHFFRDTGESGVDVCLLALADNLATYGPTLPQETWARQLDVVRTLLEAWWEQPEERVSPPPLVTGYDLMQALELKPGPRIGVLLGAIREAQATGEVKSREQALEFARSYKS
jgi:putative nucleotidyltransferase with HDIG domain